MFRRPPRAIRTDHLFPYPTLFRSSSPVRDGSAFAGTLAAGVSPITPVFHIDNVSLRNSIVGLYIVETRANLLEADKLVDDIALDRYSFIRDANLQPIGRAHV